MQPTGEEEAHVLCCWWYWKTVCRQMLDTVHLEVGGLVIQIDYDYFVEWMPEVVAGLCWLRNPPRAWGVSQLGYDEKPSEALRRPWHVRAEFSMHRVCALEFITVCTCSATDRWLVKVIQSILITETRATFGIGCGSCTGLLRFLSMKTISAYLVGLTLRLLTRVNQFRLPTVGVDSWDDDVSVISKIIIWLPGVIGFRSPVLTTYDGTKTLDNAGCNCRHRR